MNLRKSICTLVLLASAAAMSRAQANSGETPPAAPGAALPSSEDEAAATSADNPSGPDRKQSQPSERHSFFLGGLHIDETAETNSGPSTGSSTQISSFTSALGSLHLLSLKRRSETAIDYVGGADIYGASQNISIQQLNATQRILWRRGQLVFTDEFGDLPGGNFGSDWFGGAAAYNLGLAGMSANPPAPADLSSFFGASNYTGRGITNASTVGFAQTLTPRSSITATGGYGITDYSLYSANSQNLINNHGIGAQASYNYQLNRRNQIGFFYGYQDMQFALAGAGNLETNQVELIFSRQVSRRMDFELGAGPDFVKFSSQVNGPVDRTGGSARAWFEIDPEFARFKRRASESQNQIGFSGFASLNYHLRKDSFALSYERLVTNGSGLFAGANTDACQLSFTRPARQWSLGLDAGYVRLSEIGQLPGGIPGQSYQYGFAGVAIQRQLGRYLSSIVGYQFSDQSSGSSRCAVSAVCPWNGQTHALSAGIHWFSRPRRLE